MINEWKWYCSNNEEFYHGEFATREEAIAVGFEHYGAEGTLFIIEARHSEPQTDVFDFDRILKDYEERNEEHWGEDGEPLSDIKWVPAQTRALEQELGEVLRRFLAKHDALRSWAFTETRNREEINMDASRFFYAQDFCEILLCAFRYALGRKTYVVSGIADQLIRNWDDLGYLQDQICKEIDEAIAANTAGMEMDVKVWQRVLEHHRKPKE